MSWIDSLGDKEKVALNAVIDHAAQSLTSQIVPAIRAAGDEMVDRGAKSAEAILARANADVLADVNTIIGDLRAELAALRALLERLDGANVTLRLGQALK